MARRALNVGSNWWWLHLDQLLSKLPTRVSAFVEFNILSLRVCANMGAHACRHENLRVIVSGIECAKISDNFAHLHRCRYGNTQSVCGCGQKSLHNHNMKKAIQGLSLCGFWVLKKKCTLKLRSSKFKQGNTSREETNWGNRINLYV